MFTFAQNIFNAGEISTKTGTRFYFKTGFLLLEPNIGLPADVFDHLFCRIFLGDIFLREYVWNS